MRRLTLAQVLASMKRAGFTHVQDERMMAIDDWASQVAVWYGADAPPTVPELQERDPHLRAGHHR